MPECFDPDLCRVIHARKAGLQIDYLLHEDEDGRVKLERRLIVPLGVDELDWPPQERPASEDTRPLCA